MKRVMAGLVVLAATMAAQGQGRAINFTQEIKNLDGTVILMPRATEADKPVGMTLGDVAVNALETPTAADQQMTGEDKFKLDLLAHKIYKAKSVTLTPEEIKTIKERIGKIYASVVVGAAWRMLDPDAK